jgi:radical SAM protein with 4Fe4S-binding SPASM domain
MTYVVQQPVADGLLLYNTLTCSLLLLTPDEAADIMTQQELIDRWFMVPQEHDDRELCRQIRQMAALLKPVVKAVTNYVILPTTGCNARCFYCYEKGTKPVTMTAETASKVVRYIMDHRGDEKVGLRWFGGEPLVNTKVIDQICMELSRQGVPFYSDMVSNGYLFDVDMVQRAKDLWQLEWVQITLDGTEQTYNRVKDYVYQGVNTFERVLENIGLLTAAGIQVRIRLNVDKYNIKEMAELVELLHQCFGNNQHLVIYSHELHGERTPEDNAELFAQRMELQQQIEACGYGDQQLLRLQRDIQEHGCMANTDFGVLISPDGHLGKCQHIIDSEFFGHIDSEERDEAILRKFKERRSDIEACATCFYYPQCSFLVMCHHKCSPETRKESLRNMMKIMKHEYECYLSKNEKEKEKEDETEI